MAPLWPPNQSTTPDQNLESTVYFAAAGALVLAGFVVGCACCRNRKSKRVDQCPQCSEMSGVCVDCMQRYEQRGDERNSRGRDRNRAGRRSHSSDSGGRRRQRQRGRYGSRNLASGSRDGNGDRRDSNERHARGSPARGSPHHPPGQLLSPAQRKNVPEATSADTAPKKNLMQPSRPSPAIGKGAVAQKKTDYLDLVPKNGAAHATAEKVKKVATHQPSPTAKGVKKIATTKPDTDFLPSILARAPRKRTSEDGDIEDEPGYLEVQRC